MMIIYIAGIQNIPTELIEAAEIDGANKFQTLYKIIIPMTMPSVTICLFLTLTNCFKLFDQNLALTAGGPAKKTAMLAYDIYTTFYNRNGWEGVGQAKAVIFFIIVAAISLTQLYFTRRKEVENKRKQNKNEIIENPAVSKGTGIVITIVMTLLAVAFLFPIFLVLMNSFKNKLYISDAPFALPNSDTFSGMYNYVNGIQKTGLLVAAGRSAFITICSVIVIVLLTSMAAWWITRVTCKLSTVLYYLFVFAMIVPFQMVMFTLSKVTDFLHLGNMFGIIPVYLGFGAGLSLFMFCGFIKAIPISLEEAAMIDGCTPVQTYFKVIVPMLRPTMITVAILNAMWIWNDYLLPTLVLDSEKPTIPMAVQYLRGGYGSIDMGAMMAMLVLAILPIIVFYLTCQKYIIKGVAAGAVKG